MANKSSLLVFIILFSLFSAALLLAPENSLAEYELIIDYPELPFENAGSPEEGLLSYLRYIYMGSISIVAATALIMLVYSGFVYMLSESVTSKESAIERIRSALSGLLLALMAFLILNTINPDLVSLREPKAAPINIEGSGKETNWWGGRYKCYYPKGNEEPYSITCNGENETSCQLNCEEACKEGCEVNCAPVNNCEPSPASE